MFSGAESMLRYRSHFLVRHVVETAANGLAGGGDYIPAVALWSAIDKTGRGGLARNLRNPALPDRAVAELSAAEFDNAQRFGETLTIDHAAEFALETLEKLATD